MRRRAMPMIAALLSALLVLVGCAPGEETPPTGGFLDPDAAFESMLSWLQATYPDAAPDDGLAWVSEDVVVTDADGQPLVGAAERRYTATGWVADVTWAVVAPEYLVYQITLKSPVSGWFWEGSVKAQGGRVSEDTGLQQMTESLASELAMEYVKGSPTYIASGMSGTLVIVDSLQAPGAYAWTFVLDFESRHSGYGYDDGQPVLQVITPHRAAVTVASMEVVEAVMDGRWDMMAQQFMRMSEESARDIAGLFVRNSSTFVFDGILGTLELAETLYPDVENAFTFVFRFESAHAGYGDRTGQVLAEVITPHEAHVTVQDGAVVSALMDGTWDMLQQKLV